MKDCRSFDDFVLAYIKGEKPAFANVGSQVRFLEPRPNGTQVDYLFRYEDVAGWTSFLETRLGQKIELDRLNTSPGSAPELSRNVASRFRRRMSDEVELWESIPIRG